MISDIRIFDVKAGDIVKEKKTVDTDEIFSMEISGDIDLKNPGYKVLIIYVDVYYYHNTQLYTFASINNFSCQMTETDIVKFSEDDYKEFANAIQSAISVTQLIFMQKSAKLNIELMPMPTPLYNETYNNLKSGVYTMWN